ncbi:MAG: SprT-like domain-containing protein [Acidimicrobiia bacterium]|nr:SprT-like domain-containing protein [Acidimicrobiia bacterium]
MVAVQLPLFEQRRRTVLVGDAALCRELAHVIEIGFPHVAATELDAVEVRWNPRLRSTVGRAMRTRPGSKSGVPCIEVSRRYHDAYPEELRETLAHELAHVLHWGAGHGPAWQRELAAALGRLGIEVRDSMRLARQLAPVHGSRYTWVCEHCGETIAHRDRRRADEVAMTSRCCGAAIAVLDRRLGGSRAARRPFLVMCRACGLEFRAYEERAVARRFARKHRCRCDGVLRVVGVTSP